MSQPTIFSAALSICSSHRQVAREARIGSDQIVAQFNIGMVACCCADSKWLRYWVSEALYSAQYCLETDLVVLGAFLALAQSAPGSVQMVFSC